MDNILVDVLKSEKGTRVYNDSDDYVIEVTFPSGIKTKVMIPKDLEYNFLDISKKSFGLNLVAGGHYE